MVTPHVVPQNIDPAQESEESNPFTPQDLSSPQGDGGQEALLKARSLTPKTVIWV